MAGLVPAIHVFLAAKTWMPGTSPGHDERETEAITIKTNQNKREHAL